MTSRNPFQDADGFPDMNPEQDEVVFPNTVSFFEPLEVYIPISMLREITENNLRAMKVYIDAQGEDMTLEGRSELEQAVRQREEFLSWLARHPRQATFMAIYPVQEKLLPERED